MTEKEVYREKLEPKRVKLLLQKTKHRLRDRLILRYAKQGHSKEEVATLTEKISKKILETPFKKLIEEYRHIVSFQ